MIIGIAMIRELILNGHRNRLEAIVDTVVGLIVIHAVTVYRPDVCYNPDAFSPIIVENTIGRLVLHAYEVGDVAPGVMQFSPRVLVFSFFLSERAIDPCAPCQLLGQIRWVTIVGLLWCLLLFQG